MNILIKISGALLDSPPVAESLARQLAVLYKAGYGVAVVHGGGNQINAYLEERGVPCIKRDGLRVTTPEVLDAVRAVSGKINTDFVVQLRALGVDAVGAESMPGGFIRAKLLNADLGAVGEPLADTQSVLNELLNKRQMPVIPCVAPDTQNNWYNINADSMAVACAISCGAGRIVFLTNTNGVMDQAKQTIAHLDLERSRELIEQGVAKEGMKVKLEMASAALAAGIGMAQIAPGTEPDILTRLVCDNERLGTLLTREMPAMRGVGLLETHNRPTSPRSAALPVQNRVKD
jgi:acetylglutamate kinase